MGRPHTYGVAPHIPDGFWSYLWGGPTRYDGLWSHLWGSPTHYDGLWDQLWGGPTLMGQPHTFLMDFGITYGAAPQTPISTYGAEMDPQLHLRGRSGSSVLLMGQPHGFESSTYGADTNLGPRTYGADPQPWNPLQLMGQAQPPPPLMGQPHGPPRSLMGQPSMMGPPLMGQKRTHNPTYGAETNPQCYLWGRDQPPTQLRGQRLTPNTTYGAETEP